MVELIAKSACDGLLPASFGRCTVREQGIVGITSISPSKGKEKAVSAEMKEVFGIGFPAPNRANVKGDARCVWMGPGQAFLIGPMVVALNNAALTDQSDGWARMQLEGADCEAVLARLVPVDLRSATFEIGHTARTNLFHAALSITKTGVTRFELLAFRSMAKTVIDELSVAMKSVAAQQD